MRKQQSIALLQGIAKLSINMFSWVFAMVWIISYKYSLHFWSCFPMFGVLMVTHCKFQCVIMSDYLITELFYLQWNLRIMDTLGTSTLSIVQMLSLLRR